MRPDPVVLVVEDELPMQQFLRTLLAGCGLRVVVEGTAEGAVRSAAMHAPEVVLLDLGLPDQDGLDVVRRLRAWSQTPVIVLSARGGDRDKVEALDAGADDYLTKPFSAQELMARVRVALRHRSSRVGEEPAVFESGGVAVDLARRVVTRAGQPVPLTPTEYRVLELLVRHAGRVLTHAHILREVWGPRSLDRAHYVRVHVHALRTKLEDDPTQPSLILTESGVGYRLRE
ncbi:MAG: response regulator [Pseudomonadota bacterium]